MSIDLKSQIEQLGATDSVDLYRMLVPEGLGMDEEDEGKKLKTGKKIFQQVLPQARAHLCGKPLYRKLLVERPHRTHVEIAVLLSELLPGATIMHVPVGPVLLIIVREMFETLCPEGGE